VISLLGVVVVALAVRAGYVRIVSPNIGRYSDARAYHLLADNLAHGRGYIRPYDLELLGVRRPTAEYPPMFPAVLAVGSRLGFGSLEGHRLFLCGFGAVTVGLIGLLGQRIGGPAVGLAAAAVAAVYPMLFQSDAALMPETLAALLGVALVLLAVWVRDRPDRWWRWTTLGLVLGLAVMTRAELAVFVPLLLGPLAWRLAQRTDARRSLLAAGVAVLCLLAVVLPWTVRNWQRFDAFVPVSNNLGSVIRGANCEPAYHGEYRGIWVVNLGNETSGTVDPKRQCFRGFQLNGHTNEAQASATDRTAGLHFAAAHAGQLPAVMAVRWLRTFGLYRPAQQTGFEALEGRDLSWERRGTWTFYGLAVLAAVGLLAWRWRPHAATHDPDVPRWVLLVPVIAVSLTVMATYGNQRFRAAAEPVLVVMAATAFMTGAEAVRRRRHRSHKTAPPSAAGAGGTVR